MTPDQQQLVQYAEAMGFHRAQRLAKFPRWNFPDFSGGMRVWKEPRTNGKIWNPLTDANDALELAREMKIAHEHDGEGEYSAQQVPSGHRFTADTLCRAICAAVDAALEAKE